MFIKGVSIAVSIILVPLTIRYINTTEYGIWLTLTSIVAWFGFFDIGFNHGLRNKFAQALANGEEHLAKTYVSTTYAALGIIISIVLVLFFCVNPFLNWVKILNSSPEIARELTRLATIVFTMFCLQFIFQLITTVSTANQEPAKASFFTLSASLLSLVIIFILTKTTPANIVYLGTALSSAPVLIFAVAGFWLYNHGYKKYAPSFKFVKFSIIPSLLSLGGKFFIIQIGALILFSTDNIIIAQIFGPNQVTVFNVAYKLFSLISVIFIIVITPFWSAFTDAYTKGDMLWIKLMYSKIKKIWLLLSLASLVLIVISPFIYKIWLNDTVQVPLFLSFSMGVYVSGYMWLTLYCFLLNGIGKIQVQLYLYLISMFINIPLTILFSRLWGLAGVPISNLLIFVGMGIVLWIQSNKILNNSAVGVWNK